MFLGWLSQLSRVQSILKASERAQCRAYPTMKSYIDVRVVNAEMMLPRCHGDGARFQFGGRAVHS